MQRQGEKGTKGMNGTKSVIGTKAAFIPSLCALHSGRSEGVPTPKVGVPSYYSAKFFLKTV